MSTSEQPLGQEVSDFQSQGNADQTETQERLKTVVKKLLQNKMDKMEVLRMADLMSLNMSTEESFSKQKYALQKAVLEQIVKKEPSDYFKQLLAETNEALQVKKTSQYICCLVGCLYTSGSHRSYLLHLKRIHFTHKQLHCNFKKQCRRQFSSVNLLLEHVKEAHSTIKPVQVSERVVLIENQPCRCDLLACRGKEFSGIDKLMTHLIHFHVNEERQCIFENCGTKFSKGVITTAQHHFSIKPQKCQQVGAEN